MRELLDHAIQLNYLNRPLVKTHLNPIEYAKEFKTIHINIGRRSGKTHLIMSTARENDLVIVSSYIHKMQLLECFPYFLGTIQSMPEIILSAYGLRGKVKPIVCDRVWIDEPALCEQYNNGSSIHERIDANLYIKLGA